MAGTGSPRGRRKLTLAGSAIAPKVGFLAPPRTHTDGQKQPLRQAKDSHSTSGGGPACSQGVTDQLQDIRSIGHRNAMTVLVQRMDPPRASCHALHFRFEAAWPKSLRSRATPDCAERIRIPKLPFRRSSENRRYQR